MVRDAYAAGGQPQLADGSSSTANLTQELAQLLAQSIAQGQSGKRPPGAAATGSELASLAALVSASQSQRQPYKDGLSSLAYTRPANSPPPAITPVLAPVPASASHGGMLIADPHHDDEPMPIPSTWRQPMLSDDDRWYRQQLGAAALGLIAGLIVVVPAVLWLSGFLGGPQKGPRAAVAETPPAVKIAEVKRVKLDPPPKVDTPAPEERVVVTAPRPETRAASALPLPTKAAPPPPPKVDPVRSRTEELLKEAKLRLESGDIKGAREILDVPETASSGAMMFMLAETYDPSMLAIWQTRGLITADPQKARFLYQKALSLGDNRAEQRLRTDWLGAN